MPGKQGKTTVWVALLSGPEVKTGGRDVIFSKFSLDVYEDWNEKDLRSVLISASNVPRGTSLEILRSEDGGKTVVPFKTSRANPLDGKLIASEKIKTLYLRPSKALGASESPEIPRKSVKIVDQSPEEGKGQSESAAKVPEAKRGRGRPAKFQSPDKAKKESKQPVKEESRASRNDSKTQSNREVSKSPSPKKPDSDTRRGRSPVKRQVVQKGKAAAATKEAENMKSPTRPASSPAKPASPAKSMRSPTVPTKSPGRPARGAEANKTPARAAVAASPASTSRGRGRPAKRAASPSPAKSSASPEKKAKSALGNASPEKLAKSPERPASRGRGRPPKQEDKSQSSSIGAEKPRVTQGSTSRGRGRPAKSPAPEKTSSVKQKESPKKEAEIPRKESRGRGRPSAKQEKEKDASPPKGSPRKTDKSPAKMDEAKEGKKGRGRPKKAEAGNKTPAKVVEVVTPLTEKRQRKVPKKFEDYEGDTLVDSKKKEGEKKKEPKTPAKAKEDKKQEVEKEAAIKKGQEKEKQENEKQPKEKEKAAEIQVVQVQKVASEASDATQRKRKVSGAESPEKSSPLPKQKKASLGKLKVKMLFKGKEKEAEVQKVVRAQSLSPTPKVVKPSPQPLGRPKSLSPQRGRLVLMPAKGGQEAGVRKVYVPSIADLMTGRKDIEPRNRPVTCLDCGEIVANRDQLYHHKNQCASIGLHKVYACQDCTCSYYSRTDLLDHRRREHFNNPSAHMMEQYGNKPDAPQEIGRPQGVGNWDVSGHTVKALVSGNNGKDYNICICMACRAVFINNENLEVHMREKHPELISTGAVNVAAASNVASSSNDDADTNETANETYDSSQLEEGEVPNDQDEEEQEEEVEEEEEQPTRPTTGRNPGPKKALESPAKKGNVSPAKTAPEKPPEKAVAVEETRKATGNESLRKTRGAESTSPAKKANTPAKKTPETPANKNDDSPAPRKRGRPRKDSLEPQESGGGDQAKKGAKESPPATPKTVGRGRSISESESATDDSASRRSSRKRKPSQWMKDYDVESDEATKQAKSDEEFKIRPKKSVLVVAEGTVATPKSGGTPAVAKTPGKTPAKTVLKPILKIPEPVRSTPVSAKQRRDYEELGFLCEECDAACRSAKELEMHIMDVHRIQCQCGQKFMYRADLECHKIVSCSAATWHCFECNNNFESRQSYNDHRDACASGKFKCPNCGMQSRNAMEHGKHRMSCSSRTMCKICHLFFMNKEVLLTHMEKRHMLPSEDKDKSETDEGKEKGNSKQGEEQPEVIGTVIPVQEDTGDDTEEESTSSRSTRSRSANQQSPQKGSPRKGICADAKDKGAVMRPEKGAAAAKPGSPKAPAASPSKAASKSPPAKSPTRAAMAKVVEAPKSPERVGTRSGAKTTESPTKAAVEKEVQEKVQATPSNKEDKAPAVAKKVTFTPIATPKPAAVPSTSTPQTSEAGKAGNKSVSFIVSASQLNELMAGGHDNLMKFLHKQMPPTAGPTPSTSKTPVARKQSPVKAKQPVKTPAKDPGKDAPQEPKMSFVVTATQLKELMKGGQDKLKTFLQSQFKKGPPGKVVKQPTVITKPTGTPTVTQTQARTTTVVQKPTGTPTVVRTPIATPKAATATPTAVPMSKNTQKVAMPKIPSPKQNLPPEHDPRLRRAIPLTPPKQRFPSPIAKPLSPSAQPVIESTQPSDVEETVNIPVGNSCINIPMSIIQSHIAEGHPEGTTKQLVVTTSEGVPYSVFVNANEDGSNIQIRLEKIEDEESLLALQGLQAPSPPSPPKPSKTIQVVTVSQPETQEVTVMPPTQAVSQPSGSGVQQGMQQQSPQPSILRKRRVSESAELAEAAATASMPKVPKLGNLGQYKIHCKDCQMLFDSYALFTRHACVQKAHEKKIGSPVVQQVPEVEQPEQPVQHVRQVPQMRQAQQVQAPVAQQIQQALGQTPKQVKKKTYYECSCCHQVFSSMLLFNRHVCSNDSQEGTEWKVQSLGSGGSKPGTSDVEWLIAEAGST